jgi:spoIIIJ-associated protein
MRTARNFEAPEVKGSIGWMNGSLRRWLVLRASNVVPSSWLHRAAAAAYTGLVMPIDDLQLAAQKIAGLLSNLNKLGGLRLKYRIAAGDGSRDAEGSVAAALSVELAGPDAPLLTQHNGELLRALETIAGQMLRLDQREGDLISFDAGNFKALQANELKLQAEVAADKVIRSGIPYAFPAMNSRDRRLMHMAFKDIEGVETASSGEGQDRFLAVFPAGKTHLPVAAPTRPRSFERRGERRRD